MMKLERDRITAELASLEALVGSLDDDDYLGQMSLESRIADLRETLAQSTDREGMRAKVALYFGGAPVVGSQGVQATFGADALGSFQELVSTVWAQSDGQLAVTGPIRDKAASQLHITNLVHGSFGFLLEEVDELGEPMFRTALREASEQAAVYLMAFAGEDEERFSKAIEEVNPRVFRSLRRFFGHVHRGDATFRVVEGDTDASFDRFAIARAWERAEASEIDEADVTLTGRLLGLIPVRRRFEFEADGVDQVIEGRVGDEFTEAYIERMSKEQFAGRRWEAVLRRRLTTKAGGREIESFTLLSLQEKA